MNWFQIRSLRPYFPITTWMKQYGFITRGEFIMTYHPKPGELKGEMCLADEAKVLNPLAIASICQEIPRGVQIFATEHFFS